MTDNIFGIFLTKVGNVPGVQIDRTDYLQKTFARKYKKELSSIISRGPLAAGISKDEISKIADQAIRSEAGQTTLVSAGTGVFGGPAVIAAVPADIIQFYGHIFRMMQKLMYLYGWEENIFDENGDIDDTTMNMLVLYMGVMFGIQAAGKLIAQITTHAAKKLLRDVPIRVIKAFFTKQAAREVIKKIIKAVGVKTVAKMTISASSKAVPLIGAVTSGAFTAAFFLPMSRRLKRQLADGAIEYIDAEDDL